MARKYVLGPNAARQLKTLLRGSGEVSRRQSMASAVAFESEYALPYTVQWAQSVNDGQGSWIIWLPTESCLVVNGSAIDVAEDLDDAGGDYPSGWYALDFLSEGGGDVYLNVHVAEGDEGEVEVTANFGSSADEADDGETVFPNLVARTVGKSVKVNVTSAIVLNFGGGGGGGEVGVDDKSISKITGDKLEIKGYHDLTNTETDSLAKKMTTAYGGNEESIERDRSNDSTTDVKFRKLGRFYAGNNTNIVFTPDAAGGVKIDVYWKT